MAEEGCETDGMVGGWVMRRQCTVYWAVSTRPRFSSEGKQGRMDQISLLVDTLRIPTAQQS
jgi:hypothetical protein